jgi:hypothetical protein
VEPPTPLLRPRTSNGMCTHKHCEIKHLRHMRFLLSLSRLGHSNAWRGAASILINTDTCIHTNIHAYLHIHAYIHSFIHACIHAYIHTHTHTQTHTRMKQRQSKLRMWVFRIGRWIPAFRRSLPPPSEYRNKVLFFRSSGDRLGNYTVLWGSKSSFDVYSHKYFKPYMGFIIVFLFNLLHILRVSLF